MDSIVHRRFQGFRAEAGVSRWDITPGVGIYAKNWGAATSWFATGVHRRLTGTVLALTPLAGQQPPLLLISLELGWWRNRNDGEELRRRLMNELELPEPNVVVHLTHTHSGPALDSTAPAEARPETARAYLAWLTESCLAACREALGARQPATALFRYGRCSLASERDFPDPSTPGRYLCGFHPEASVDDTLLVARLFRDDGRTLATLVNYACHPTTLAWENSLLSPDYPGAMREMVEEQTGGAPACFFWVLRGNWLLPSNTAVMWHWQIATDMNWATRHSPRSPLWRPDMRGCDSTGWWNRVHPWLFGGRASKRCPSRYAARRGRLSWKSNGTCRRSPTLMRPWRTTRGVPIRTSATPTARACLGRGRGIDDRTHLAMATRRRSGLRHSL